MPTENTFKFERTAEEIWQSIEEVAARVPEWMFIQPKTLKQVREEREAEKQARNSAIESSET